MNTKCCSKCKEIKPIDDFAKRDREGLKRHSRCKTCFNEYTKAHYKKNTQLYLDKAKRHNSKYFKETGEIIFQKKSVPCADCKIYYHPHAMDFDHLRDKLYNVGTLRCYSKKVLNTEIDKCEVVCAVCHRLRTLERKGEESMYSAHDYMVDFWKNNLAARIEKAHVTLTSKNKALSFIQSVPDDSLFFGGGLEVNPRGVSDGTELVIFLDPKHIKKIYASHNAHISWGGIDRVFLHFKEPPQNTETFLLENLSTSHLVGKLDNHVKNAVQLDNFLKRVK